MYWCHNIETLSPSLTLENKSLIPFLEPAPSMNVNSSDPTRVPWWRETFQLRSNYKVFRRECYMLNWPMWLCIHSQFPSFLLLPCFCQLFQSQIQVVKKKKKKVIMGCMHGATIERLGDPKANTCYLRKQNHKTLQFP